MTAAALLRGQGINPGEGAPSRVPIGGSLETVTTVPHSGPNALQYQKQLAIQTAKSVVVLDVTRFQRTVTLGFTLATAGLDTLLLLAPPELRVFLSIRNDVSSGGQLYISFDQLAAASGAVIPSVAAFVLPPGGFMFLDEFVPQGDVHVAATAVPTNVVITYANARFNPA